MERWIGSTPWLLARKGRHILLQSGLVNLGVGEGDACARRCGLEGLGERSMASSARETWGGLQTRRRCRDDEGMVMEMKQERRLNIFLLL